MWIICLADDSHEMSRLYSLKKIKVKLFSAAVVIDALRVNIYWPHQKKRCLRVWVMQAWISACTVWVSSSQGCPFARPLMSICGIIVFSVKYINWHTEWPYLHFLPRLAKCWQIEYFPCQQYLHVPDKVVLMSKGLNVPANTGKYWLTELTTWEFIQ